MRTIDDYMDAAKKRQAITSDRQLGFALGITGPSPSMWRNKKAWPADHTMRRLAELAGIDPGVALIELNVWRSKPEAAEIYRALLDHIPSDHRAA